MFVKFTPGGKLVTHGGSGNAYANYGCRCDQCKAANAARVRRRSHERDASTLPPEAHGKYTTYTNWRCRCEKCKIAGAAANAAAYARRKAGK